MLLQDVYCIGIQYPTDEEKFNKQLIPYDPIFVKSIALYFNHIQVICKAAAHVNLWFFLQPNFLGQVYSSICTTPEVYLNTI